MWRPTMVLAILLAAVAGTAAGETPPVENKAPTFLYHEPNAYFLLPMSGDRVSMRYSRGSLDRAANL
jgi:hypothetical protein